MAYAVTVSATFGAGGSVVGPAVAERLGVPFLDRAVPTAVAEQVGCTLEDALTRDDRAPSGLERLLAGAARLPTVTLGGVETGYPGFGADGRVLDDREFVERTEEVLAAMAERGGVVLGRAAAIVLADRPGVLHVRLDGPPARRFDQVVRLGEAGYGEALADPWADTATGTGAPEWRPPRMRDVADNDRARTAYVRRYYRTDPADSRHYHLVLDSTAVSLDTCTDIIERLAREHAGTARGAERPAG